MKKFTLQSIFVTSVLLGLQLTTLGQQASFLEKEIGNVYHVSIPDYMTKTYKLNDAASLQYLNASKETYVIVIEDSKDELTDLGSHNQAAIGIDIDLADGTRRSLAKLIFGDTDRPFHLAAVLVDQSNVVLHYARSTVQNDREARNALFDFFKNVEAQRWSFFTFFQLELESTVTGTDGDR